MTRPRLYMIAVAMLVGAVFLWSFSDRPPDWPKTYTDSRERVFNATFSANGDYIVSAWEETVRLWDWHTGKEMERIKLPVNENEGVRSVATTFDSNRVVVGGNRIDLALWDTQKKIPVWSFDGEVMGSSALAVSKDGATLVSGDYDGNLFVVDLRRRAVIVSTRYKDRLSFGRSTSLAFSSDAKFVLVTWGANDATLWNPENGKLVKSFEVSDTTSIYSAVFTGDAKNVLCAVLDGTIRVFDINTAKEQRIIVGHKGGVRAVASSPVDDRAISAGNDHTVRLWNVLEGKEIAAFVFEGTIGSAAFSPDGRMAVCTTRNSIYVWKLPE